MSANDKQVGGAHYQAGIQHWDLIEDHGIGYLEGCATKYLTRWRKKNGLQDLEKALHYTEKLLEKHMEHHRMPRGVVPVLALRQFAVANELTVEEELIVSYLCRWDCESTLKVAADNLRRMIEWERRRLAGHEDCTGQDHPFGYDEE